MLLLTEHLRTGLVKLCKCNTDPFIINQLRFVRMRICRDILHKKLVLLEEVCMYK